jgi:hypothetical protein
MERRLRVFEMAEDADPIALAESRLLAEPFPVEYAATRVVATTRPCGRSKCSPSPTGE